MVSKARELGFDTFIDLYAVDHFSQAPRFEVGINLLSMEANQRVVITTRVPYDSPDWRDLYHVLAKVPVVVVFRCVKPEA